MLVLLSPQLLFEQAAVDGLHDGAPAALLLLG
jgi:hypothetical protein